MKPILIGTEEDVAGFAMAGVDGYRVSSQEAIEERLASIDAAEAIVIFSRSAAKLVMERLNHWIRTGTGPFFVVLPEVK